MTPRQTMRKALWGHMEDGVPFAPRLDIWFYSNRYKNSLPAEFLDADLAEISSQLRCIHNKYLPDYADGYSLRAVEHRLLGFYNSKDIPYRVELDDSIKAEIRQENGLVHVSYRTKAGTVSGSFAMDETLKAQGSTLPPIQEHLAKSEADYRPLIEILSAIRIVPAPENYRLLTDRIGEQGYPAVYGHLAASPMQALLRDLLDPTLFFLEYKTNLAELLDLAKPFEKILFDIAQIVSDCTPQPVVMWGGNYDSMLTFPPFFRAHVLPFLNHVSALVHAKGGRVVSHCDGDNHLLLPLYKESGIDILQSVNVAPMVPNTYREIRDGLREDQVISGGVPATALISGATSEREFKEFLDNLRRQYRTGERLILEVSDNVTPDADLGRLKVLVEWAHTLGAQCAQ